MNRAIIYVRLSKAEENSINKKKPNFESDKYFVSKLRPIGNRNNFQRDFIKKLQQSKKYRIKEEDYVR